MTQRKQSNQKTLDERIEQARKRFHEACKHPRLESMRHMLTLTPESLANVVEQTVGSLVDSYTDNEAIALGVQLYVKVCRLFPALPHYVCVDLVVRLGNLEYQRDQFIEVLEHMELL
ncbi:hypothetical protein HXZ34_23015 [Escherichia coli]|uniref:hypothetical protein n=1 Tax=Escherichia coli TaxID=562 RepID=UPI002578F237|nr:hypothetical protein [Escherichia coli]MDM1268458.1 hypothetical protein [Escherichia coli]